MKTCPRCGIGKDDSDFFRRSDSKDGLAWQCKTCDSLIRKARYVENIKEEKATRSSWWSANKERAHETQTRWREENKEKKKATDARYAKANKEKIRMYSIKWRLENAEKLKKDKARWSVENKDLKRIYKANRVARKRDNGGSLSNGLAKKLFKLQRGKCACCGLPLGDNYHLDHIVPLARGGMNSDGNIQLLRQRCNSQKHAKHPVDFMQERGFLL